jgi:hypothetical protein
MKRHSLALATGLLALGGALRAQEVEGVKVIDGGAQMNAATWECTAGHQIRKQRITLDSGLVRYTFLASGCQDPSHEGKHPCAEGNFGMPDPTAGNWYWGGFFRVLVNGSDATVCDLKDVRVIEQDHRGAFQIVWAHLDAEVGLRLMMLPGGNHVLALLVWHPTEGKTVTSVKVQLTCYPSFFTAARNRKGERHCRTPRIDQAEPTTLTLEPEQDTYLYYYDAIFDVANGEGDGPCAALVSPKSVAGGKVAIGNYAVQTEIDLKPEAGEARLAFYDFTGLKNAEAENYLSAHADEDLVQLEDADFRPQAVRELDYNRLKADSLKLLADAAEDGKAMEPRVQELLAKVADLKTKAESGDWPAEADLASSLIDSDDLFWKLRTFAVLNNP